MADAALRLEIANLREFRAAMEQKVREMAGGGRLLAAMRKVLLWVERDTKKNTPVDTGRVRASWFPEIRVQEQVIGIEGTVVQYAPFVEEDTKPHWPPKGALKVWARRHHIGEGAPVMVTKIVRSGKNKGKIRTTTRRSRFMTEDQADYLVRRAIARHGTKGAHMLREAFANNRERIVAELGNVIGEVWAE